MQTLRAIGEGMFAPDPTIKIINPRLFNMALSAMDGERGYREYLKYLLIDPSAKTLTGSNGAAMISTPDALDFYGYQGTKKILIKPESNLPDDCIYAVINLKTQVIDVYRNKNPRMAIRFEETDIKYPELGDLLAEVNDSTITNQGSICFNPKFLRRMNKAAGSLGVSITTHKTTKSHLYRIRFLGVSGDYTAIIMPISE